MSSYQVPLIIRGEIIEESTLEFEGRKGTVHFSTADVGKHLTQLTSYDREAMAAYQALSIDSIARFLDRLGQRLNLDNNPWLQQAFELSCHTSGISSSILEALYRNIGHKLFAYENVMEFAEQRIGVAFLEGWVPHAMRDGTVASVRAFGSRSVHIIAGNTPGVAFNTILRSSVTRSDCITKMPSNDPLTFSAILRTMIEMDPEHPITRHFSGAYWKGGNESLESRLYRPEHIEKIIAWGGYDSIRHITRYLQPGIDLITLDPKHSASIIGREALVDDASIDNVALRAACDIGAYNQELCANARILYVECDYQNERELAALNRFGAAVFQAMQTLPATLSTPAKYLEPELKQELDSLFMLEDWYRVYRDDEANGAIIVSQLDEPVSFSGSLACRTANIVPVKSMTEILRRINSSTQTVGVYPATTKTAIRDALALRGAQIIISLGYVARINSNGPMDGMEPERRMLKWLVDQSQDEHLPPPWAA
tara:strand:- start:1423 stop:2874 length:1452 start_codon:yes stop_codon:yes gene_type:complete